MNRDLIFDIGMHTGRDAEFYLKKGFRVVAIEANPQLVEQARARFADAIAAGALRILNVAIHDHDGVATLYVSREKDLWSTVVADVARDKETLGASFEPVEVPCRRFESILAEEGIPYYMKIDVEGVDLLCLKALFHFADRPRYISIELAEEQPFQEISHLVALGYSGFKMLNQAINGNVRLPKPPCEGVYVDAHFDSDSSGPFGEETPLRWLDLEETVDQYRKVLARYRLERAARSSLLAQAVKRYRELVGGQRGWHDLHAKLGAHKGLDGR